MTFILFCVLLNACVVGFAIVGVRLVRDSTRQQHPASVGSRLIGGGVLIAAALAIALFEIYYVLFVIFVVKPAP
jgi:multisubunit Na+/H+ antiporter MnhG subunit